MTKAFSLLQIACVAVALMLPACAQQPTAGGPLVLEKQGSFFVGGREVRSDTLSTLPQYAPAGTITVDQMYVRYQVPANARRHSVVFIHGCCLTGKTWETTPDGRMGWDEFFIRKGYPTYVVDQAWRGRSASNPSVIVSARLGKTPPEKLPPIFFAGREDAWAIFRFGPEYPKVFPGMQFPLEAQAEFWKQMVPDWNASLAVPVPTVTALSELAKRLNGAVLISHSQSGIHPFQAAALSTAGIAGIVAIEGTCPPASGDLSPLKMPILVLYGDNVEVAPRWAPRLKQCREFVQAVNKAGGRAEIVVLPDIGIRGSSHMLMQDKNSLEIAEWLAGWIDRNVK
jgi:pimeloyl-ACP methyl ester carboxylesterase